MSWSSLTVTPASASNVSTSLTLIVVSSAPVMIGALLLSTMIVRSTVVSFPSLSVTVYSTVCVPTVNVVTSMVGITILPVKFPSSKSVDVTPVTKSADCP